MRRGREGVWRDEERKKKKRSMIVLFVDLFSSTSTSTSSTSNSTKKTGGFAETERRRVTFPEIPAPVLEHVCQYFYYKLQYNNA